MVAVRPTAVVGFKQNRRSTVMQLNQIISQLQVLCETGTLSDRTQKTAMRLLHRLSSPVRIDVLGPDEGKCKQLRKGLAAQEIPHAAVMTEPVIGADAFQKADICIWCTTDFAEAEAIEWQGAPDLLKDHSFLVPLTIADELGSTDQQTRIEALWEIASQDFHSLLPLAFQDANSTPDDRSLVPLVTEISNLVTSGRNADQDHAIRILRDNRVKKADVTESADDPPEMRDRADETISHQIRPEDLSVDTPPADIYKAALHVITDQAEKIVCPQETENKEGIDRVLAVCQDIFEAAAVLFSTATSTDPDFGRLQDDILGASDRLLLMRTEGTIEAAITGVTNLLQTRRDLKTRLLN